MSAILQQRFDDYIDARKRFEDAQAELNEQRQDAVDTEALAIAEKRVRDPHGLLAMVMRGDLVLHEITVRRNGNSMTLEQAICEEIAWSLTESRSGLKYLADALIEEVAGKWDVIEEAEAKVPQEHVANYDNDYL